MKPNVINNFSKRSLDFKSIHFTDIHLMNTVICNARVPIFTNKVLNTEVDLIINSGDTIDDYSPLLSWTNLKSTLESKCPLITARGNHDFVYTNTDLGMPSSYYYYDFGTSWRFIILHSQEGGTYNLGATQTAWLSTTLSNTPLTKNVCIISHVTILGVSALMWYLRNNQGWSNTVDYHSDSKQIIDIFKQYPNVKLCLSGHQHTIDKVEHEGITYLCSGAVAANWYGDTSYVEKGYPAGYRLIDFYKDGSIREKFITF
jgi:3',5'-cyclic-AMP phosphodiesterase